VLDLAYGGSLFVTGVYELEVEQNLLGIPGATLDDIQKVISHPQALSQCENYLRKNGWKTEDAVNTATAAKFVGETGDKTLAAIGTKEAAERYGHPIYLISDEPYRELVYSGEEPPFIPSIYRDTLVCYSYSKSFSLPGERIGYVCVPDGVTDGDEVYAAVAGAARRFGYVCAPSLLQKVVEKCVDVMPDLSVYRKNRDLLYSALTEYGYDCVHPDGAFYLFVRSPKGDGAEFSERAKAKNLLVVPGAGFGAKDYIRVAYCVDTDMISRALPVFRELIEE
jgi:aspartate aminotransferase